MLDGKRGLGEMGGGFALAKPPSAVPLRVHSAPTFALQWLLPRLGDFQSAHPGIDLRISANVEYATFENDFDLDIVCSAPCETRHEWVPLAVEEITPLCAPPLAARIRCAQDLYGQTLIQSEMQSVQSQRWFVTNDMEVPSYDSLAFDRSCMAISAAAAGLGVVVESTLLAAKELASGRLVAPLRDLTHPVGHVGHYLVHPKRHRQQEAFERFRDWLLAECGSKSVRP